MSLLGRSQAWGELLRRYSATFAHFWRLRHELRTDFFNEQEAEFLPARLSLQEAPDSRSLKWTARLLMALVCCAVVWSIFGKVDIIVNATGKVIPSSRTKTIGSLEVASVKALHVVEGQEVHAGDVLVELESSGSDAEHDKAADAAAQARLQVARSDALIDAVTQLRPPRLPRTAAVSESRWVAASLQLAGQYQDFRAKLTRLEGEIARYEELLPLATQRAQDYKALVSDRTVSEHAWLEKEQARADLHGQLADARNQRNALIAQTLKEAHDARTEGEKAAAAAAQDQRRAGEHSRLMKLVAPVDGTVQQLAIHTVGGVVPAAQALMQIVPQEHRVEVEAFLENRDVGFVRTGQLAEIKVDAFDYTRYGTVRAQVSHVSRDAIQDEKRGPIYSVKVVMDKNDIAVDGRTVPLAPGMSVSVEIKTGTRRVIEYVLSPLMQHQREALHER